MWDACQAPVYYDDGGNNTDNDYDDVDVGDEKEDDILHCASHMIVFTLCLEKRTNLPFPWIIAVILSLCEA